MRKHRDAPSVPAGMFYGGAGAGPGQVVGGRDMLYTNRVSPVDPRRPLPAAPIRRTTPAGAAYTQKDRAQRSAAMNVARHVTYSGRVQGVGFRYTAQQLAAGYPVAGFVRNLP